MTDTSTEKTTWPAEVPAPTVVVRGVLGIGIDEYAEAKVTAVLRRAHGPVRHVRITVTRRPDPAVAEPLVAMAHVDVGGVVLHAHATAETAHTAVDRLAHRLSHQVATHARHRRGPRPTSVNRGTAPGRRVVAHPAYGAGRCSVEEAIADLDALGYDFHLFTDDSGEDCLVRRTAGGYLLAAAHGSPPSAEWPMPVWSCDGAAPRMDAGKAQVRLDLSAEPLLFYVDDTDNRGRLLYRRADGDYGLVFPVPENGVER
ncbi:ribosome hibernation promotion factor [Actinokineospora sp. HUAS TT18]|uniref:ribosome hibernation promotion factor n=1 Tax=Actinokineospora sp. HUAS TT18 TaxID=3447451 RepID=UPI003F520040